MDEITLKNYRCFADEQTARLASLTLLVGENSTGKTSFLALIRALSDVAHGSPMPDFNKPPYNLGSFDEIVHLQGVNYRRLENFEASLTVNSPPPQTEYPPGFLKCPYHLQVKFGNSGTIPVAIETIEKELSGENWIKKYFELGGRSLAQCGTSRGQWKLDIPLEVAERLGKERARIPPMFFLMSPDSGLSNAVGKQLTPLIGSPPFTSKDEYELDGFVLGVFRVVPFTMATAPVQSKPNRTYHHSVPFWDPSGGHVPNLLASLYLQDKANWKALKNAIENFGANAGLFNEINIRSLGERASDPFQLQVRTFEGKRKGLWHNFVDVGYGISQVLPIVTELLRADAATLFLFQQPEVHLHPSAQAALGSLFCKVAARGHQLIVETHSDYILDRIRMDIRDCKSDLKPEDVSILFFERQGRSVQIHSIRLDQQGNLIGAPPSYRSFFLEETDKFLGLH